MRLGAELVAEARMGDADQLVGVAMAGIGDGGNQLVLFGDGPRLRRAALNRALDRIVQRFGRESIVRGDGGRWRRGSRFG